MRKKSKHPTIVRSHDYGKLKYFLRDPEPVEVTPHKSYTEYQAEAREKKWSKYLVPPPPKEQWGEELDAELAIKLVRREIKGGRDAFNA